MSRIDTAFQRLRAEGRKALVPFITAGDPDLGVTVDLMHALVEAGADIIELGVPFSDPMADGPVIQRASERALARGVGLQDVLACVERFRRRDAVTPVVLMGYANPVENMGYEPFATRAQRAGVDGLLTVDLPPEESEPLVLCLREHGIAPVFLISPTSTEARMRDVARLGGGFIYYVSLKGVTGAAHLDLTEVARRLPDIKALTSLPVGVGFGIRDAETARAVAGIADAVVVGSRIVQEIESSSPAEVVGRVRALVADLRSAMDGR